MNICICAPNESAVSETFIANHIRNLPGKVYFLHGGWLPTHEGGTALASTRSLPTRIWDRLRKRDYKAIHIDLLQDFIRRNGIDVVLCEYGLTGVHMLPVIVGTQVPLVVHFHGFDAHHQATIEENKVTYPRLFNTARYIIAVSETMQEQLIRLGASPEKLVLIPCGVDEKLFFPLEKTVLKPSIVSVTRFVPKKAPHIGILAFNEVLRDFPEAHLTIIGNGGADLSAGLIEACKQLARALKIQEHITFTGALPPEKTASLLREAGIYMQHSVVTSTGDSEGTPNSIIEAAASGLPIVATRHAGIPGVVEHGENGLLSEEYEIPAMAENLRYLLSNADVALEMGRKGRQKFLKHFRLADKIADLHKVLQRATSTPGP